MQCVTWFERNKPDGRTITMWPGSAMHGYLGWRYPRFEDFEYTSWLPEDDTMAWLGIGNTLAELSGEGDTTLYIILPVATKHYSPPALSNAEARWLDNKGGGKTEEQIGREQHKALKVLNGATFQNDSLNANRAAEKKLAAIGEIAPLVPKVHHRMC